MDKPHTGVLVDKLSFLREMSENVQIVENPGRFLPVYKTLKLFLVFRLFADKRKILKHDDREKH